VPVRYRAIPVVTAGFVRRAHELGLYVHVWTINDPAEMHRLLDLGVDGIVSDRADLLKSVLQTRGQWA
jgi:glycerophosphoryl diester phosphodiesterase